MPIDPDNDIWQEQCRGLAEQLAHTIAGNTKIPDLHRILALRFIRFAMAEIFDHR